MRSGVTCAVSGAPSRSTDSSRRIDMARPTSLNILEQLVQNGLYRRVRIGTIVASGFDRIESFVPDLLRNLDGIGLAVPLGVVVAMAAARRKRIHHAQS